MAIDIKCPHCAKPYKLKDDMAGKRVQCANQACRKPFAVEPTANGVATAAPPPPKPTAAPKPPPPKSMDADALAAAALSEDERAATPSMSVVHMTCTMCEHKWDVGVEMQGKNVLCPDCKHRQKVPIPKDKTKQDWRVRQGPQGAKLEELTDVAASTNQNTVSGSTLLATGVVKIEYEPRPASFYVKIAASVLIPLVLIGGGAMWALRSKTETAARVKFTTILEESAEDLKPLPVYRGLLRAVAAEYEAALDQPAGGKNETSSRDKAVADIQLAVADLKEAPKGYDRDLLFGELAVTALRLGGEGEDLKDKRRLAWTPQVASAKTRGEVKPSPAEMEGVQGLLRRIFQAMAEKEASFETRALVARRVTREALKAGAPAELVETFAANLFSDAEKYEGDGQIGLECLRAGQKDAAKRIAERLVEVAGANPPPVSLVALGKALETPVPVKFDLPAPPAGGITENSRIMLASLKAVQKDEAAAVEVTKRASVPGTERPVSEKVRALAVAADLSDNLGTFVTEAAGLALAAKSENATSPVTAYRLACAAARANIPPEPFLDLISDDTLKPWAKAETMRLSLAASKGPAPDLPADLPTDPKQLRGGHAWMAYHIARYNMAKTGDGKLLKQYAGWAKPFGYFGKAGVAVGQLDRGK